MIEPKSPVTIKVRYSPYPALLLASDENIPLKPKSVILRHRHLRQQQTVVRSSVNTGGPSRPIRGVVIGTVSRAADVNMECIVGREACADSAGVVAPPALAPCLSAVAVPPPVNAQPALHAYAYAPLAIGQELGTKSRSGPEPMKIPAIVPPTSKGKLLLTRGSHAIRNTAYKTTWYTTEGPDYLLQPITVPAVQVGDIYVHLASDGRQAWLRTSSNEWIAVNERHPHPFLRDYVLRFLDNGEPRWVTKESLRTYDGREKKARREEKSPSTESS